MPPEQTPLDQQESFNFWETSLKRNFAPWFLTLCAVLIIIGVSISGYFKYQAYKNYKSGLLGLEEQVEETQRPNLQTYKNEEYGFEFEYPNNFVIGKYQKEDNIESDISWNNAIVLIESNLVGIADRDSIPVGEISTISIKPIVESADFYRRMLINENTPDPKFSQYPFVVTSIQNAPGIYEDSAFYYLVSNDKTIIEITAHKNRFSRYTEDKFELDTPSNYEKVIEEIIIPTFKLQNTTDNNVGWQNYKNSGYNFEINLPQGWQITEDQARYPGSTESYPRFIIKKENNCYASIIFKSPDNIERFTYSLSEDAREKEVCQQNLDQILATFKIIG